MKKITEKKIKDLNDFTSFITSLITDSKPLWYRGCGNSNYPLIAKLYRHPTIKNVDELLRSEIQIMSWFKQRSHIYLDRPVSDDWDYLFLMQHFGIPTRLLDWTENPFIALYFAATRAHKEKNGHYANDAAVWILNAEEWNKTILKHVGYGGGIISMGDEALKGYASAEVMNNDPVAIYGTHSNKRIVAQRGVFTIFGKNMNAIENIYSKNRSFKQSCLTKIIIEKENIDSVISSLLSIGYTDSVVFPDLEGLGKEIKRKFKYEV